MANLGIPYSAIQTWPWYCLYLLNFYSFGQLILVGIDKEVRSSSQSWDNWCLMTKLLLWQKFQLQAFWTNKSSSRLGPIQSLGLETFVSPAHTWLRIQIAQVVCWSLRFAILWLLISTTLPIASSLKILDSWSADNAVDGSQHFHRYMDQRAFAPVYSGLLPSLLQTGWTVQNWVSINPMTAKSHWGTLLCRYNRNNSNSRGVDFSKLVL
jgi:hypothetical protein